MKIGVLGLQGDVHEHLERLRDVGVDPVIVKKPQDLAELRGLILPGGESTTIGKLMRKYELLEPIRAMGQNGIPLYGTCAGMILLAREIEGGEEPHLALMNIRVARNSFGRQKDSFETDLSIEGIAGPPFRAVFIRAPHVTSVGDDVEVMAAFNGRVVAVRQGTLLATSFHPELTDDPRVHEYFVEMCRKAGLPVGGTDSRL
ncbi:pyridoxal 5'-phosphate synthase glutaminase subunit PdxT [Kyrpidia spormannii]|uniref:Pyridoxal 5'-phosphate synthase subunit PdxT n=1 Tax=Kyrpidia spormannii TaxID=2055160 RepID=A0A2K8N1I8_9BACL|nr:pyridoxal 5'-phosphate synthase glutaminase subunit PdxT [Kyrpidia spormannii]ATY83578.1 pyridoxal 5'-phosphate synthase glutaminase subunit PdxT [Kyrpidia spormannii]